MVLIFFLGIVKILKPKIMAKNSKEIRMKIVEITDNMRVSSC